MPLPAGTRLGPYEIRSTIGAGGMGEVPKACDTRLDRVVAIRVLLGHIANRGDVLARFEHKAPAFATVNHPDSCPLFFAKASLEKPLNHRRHITTLTNQITYPIHKQKLPVPPNPVTSLRKQPLNH